MKRLAETTRSSLVMVALMTATAACTGEFDLEGPPLSSGSGTRADASPGIDGETYFRQNILPLMSSPRPKGACGICHQNANPADGPDFLGLTAESNYSTILNTPGLIGPTPAQSRFYTRGAHAGDAFLPGELGLIEAWIAAEN